MSSKPSLGLKFFGSATPLIVTKPKATNVDTLLRPGFELISNMSGTIQMYYIKGTPEPLSKRNMMVSIFLTQLVRQFKNLGPDDDHELWVFLGNDANVKRNRNG